jgi:predicted nucleic acid-binding protein
MVISAFKGKKLFLDSAPLIYFIDGVSSFQPILSELFTQNDLGYFSFVTSTITLLEVQVLPLRSGRDDIAANYRRLLTESTSIEIIDLTKDIATTAARLRAKYSLKTPDSIQIATAIEYNADFFLTNDLRLKNIEDVNTLTLQDLQ